MASQNRRVEQHNPMSPREWQVLCRLARGLGATRIAEQLQVTRNYIYATLRLLRARFDADSIAGIVQEAIAEGIIDPDGKRCGEEGQ